MCATEFSLLLMRYSSIQNGHFYQIFLSSLYTFSNSCRNFTGFSKSPSNDTVSIAHHNNSSKGEGSTTFRYFGNTIDSNQSVFQLYVTAYLNSINCHNLLKFKSTVTCSVCNLFHSTVIQVTIAIENDSCNTSL